MKWIDYKIAVTANYGTEEKPKEVTVFYGKRFPYSEENLEIAQCEAYNGEYTIEDDGVAETIEPTPEERITELEEALNMLLNGVTE